MVVHSNQILFVDFRAEAASEENDDAEQCTHNLPFTKRSVQESIHFSIKKGKKFIVPYLETPDKFFISYLTSAMSSVIVSLSNS